MSHSFQPLNHEHLALAQNPQSEMAVFTLDTSKLNGASYDDALAALEEFFIRLTGSNAAAGSKHGLNEKAGRNAADFEAFVSKFGVPAFD